MSIRVRSDSVASLGLLLKLKSGGEGSNLIAQEMALDVADRLYVPDVLEHVRGLSDQLADALSRLEEPGANKTIPPIFKHAHREDIPLRGKQSFRTLQGP